MVDLETMKARLSADFMTVHDFLDALKNDYMQAWKEQVSITEYDSDTHKNNIVWYYDIPACMDIETTNVKETKTAYMYILQININGYSTYVRTWAEYGKLLAELRNIFSLGPSRRLVLYIHNMGFEGSYIMPRFKHMTEMFATSEHNPVKIRIASGFEFRDSLILSGMSLAKTADNLTMFNIKKLSGDLDYNIPRNSETVLTHTELQYCLHDVTTLTAYIYEQICLYGDITKIPMTNTGRVRRYVQEHCLYKESAGGKQVPNKEYREIVHALTLAPEEYADLKRCFMGGYTHASAKKSGGVYHHVSSYDFTSSYPTIICSEQFPMEAGETIIYNSWAEYFRDLQDYCIMSEVDFYDLDDSKFPYEHYISQSKCIQVEGAILDNGRIAKCNYCKMIITEQDLDIIMHTYTCGKMVLQWSRRYKKGYLPAELIKCVLHFYESKTTLKGVTGKEAEYLNLKGMLNSIYGMMVTDIVQPETEYDAVNGWSTKKVELVKAIEKYNKDKKRTTFYPWGVWITAYARHNLWTGIQECGTDYIYSDTDSVKILNAEKHADYFNKYNADIIEKINTVCKMYKIDPAKACPLSKTGKPKQLGIWDAEGYYKDFKTLGAKRYIIRGHYDTGGNLVKEYEITIAGINKKTGGNYIFKQNDPFKFFQTGMKIPAEFSGKQAVTYTNSKVSAEVKDLQGHTEIMHESGCAYIYETEYCMNMSDSYLNFIKYGTNSVKDLNRIIESGNALAGV